MNELTMPVCQSVHLSYKQKVKLKQTNRQINKIHKQTAKDMNNNSLNLNGNKHMHTLSTSTLFTVFGENPAKDVRMEFTKF